MKKIIILILAFGLIGCGTIRGSLISISEEDLKNAETTRVVAQNLLKTWKINSGFIRGSLGDRINQLPKGVVLAMEELDALADKTTWTDFELGYSVGVRVRLLGELVAQALKLYAPEVLKYIPLVF
jgi:hypothetical protein